MSQDIVDKSVFDDLAEAMGQDFAAELVETFLGDAGNMIAELKQAVEANDADAYRRGAHSIKSNAQTFGAAQLASDARDMELSGEIDPAAVAQLEVTLEAAASALRDLLNG